MRLSLYGGMHEMFRERGAEGLAAYLEEKGIAYYEPCQIVDGHHAPELDDEKMLELTDSGKLKLMCYTMYVDLYYGDTDAVVRDIKRNLDLAKRLGAKYYHQTIVPKERFGEECPDYDTVNKKVFPLLVDVCKYALSLGIMPIFEPQGMYYNGIDGLGRLIKALESELGEGNVGVVFDMGNMLFIDEDPFEFLVAFADKVKHVHIKNYKLVTDGVSGYPTKNGRRFIDCFANEGVIDAEKCIRYLEEHGYTGVYSSEVLVKGYDPHVSGEITFDWLLPIIKQV